MFYLNRTGQPEGPFSEQQLVEMIRSGQLREGWIAAQGQNQWAPLGSLPSCAQALAQGSGYGAPAQAQAAPQGYQGAPQGHYGPPAQGQATPQGHQGAPQGYAQGPGPGSQKQGTSKLPLLLGLGAAALVVVIGVGAWAAYTFLFAASGPRIAAVLPQTTEAYVEVPNVRAAALAAGKARYLKADPSKDDAWLKDQAAVVTRSFGIDESTAAAVALAQRSIGLGISGLKNQPKGSIVLLFDAASPVEKLLASPRFKQEGSLGSKGKRYSLSPKAASAPAGAGWTRRLEEVLDSAHTDEQVHLGWWESAELLAVGSPEFLASIAQVQDGKQPPLTEVDRFKRAMAQNPADAVVLGWFDGVAGKNLLAAQPEVQLALTDEGAALSLSGHEAGVLTRVLGTLVGADINGTKWFFEPGALAYPEALPAETVAYLAMSTKTSLDGPSLERELRAAVKRKSPDAEANLKNGAEQLQKLTGVSLADALGALGDEVVVAALAPSDLKLQGLDPQALSSGGAVLALRLKNPAVAEKLVTQLRDQVLTRELGSKLAPKGKGMVIQTPFGADVVVEVAFVDGQLVVAGGAKAMVAKALAAVSGSGARLAADEGHTVVRETLPKQASQILWVDTGRILDRVLAGNPALASMSKQMGVSIDQIQLTGPTRLTTAAALTLRAEPQAWHIVLDSTNFAHALGLMGGLGSALFMSGASTALAGSLAGLPTTPLAAVPGGSGGVSCDQAIRCCKVLMSKSGQPSSNCDGLAGGPPAACAQSYQAYARAATALGTSCD